MTKWWEKWREHAVKYYATSVLVSFKKKNRAQNLVGYAIKWEMIYDRKKKNICEKKDLGVC